MVDNQLHYKPQKPSTYFAWMASITGATVFCTVMGIGMYTTAGKELKAMPLEQKCAQATEFVEHWRNSGLINKFQTWGLYFAAKKVYLNDCKGNKE